ncbi:Eisosome assembly protein [Didymosphaeria variabile]|uniref:Eisosome assembly protein n=1 Tax=Didymosphaeria variabile TaxID=1932322 RepID=A0A9W8X9F5_9PLEO|nr:Eisosome assembly protein [Didymosphaeria variabile]KAJ4344837.1 Eisosome assembly protein [Didymosphaeria variabile]
MASDKSAVEESDDLYRDPTSAGRTSGEEPAAVRTSATEDGTSAPRPSTAKDDSSNSPTSPTSPTKKRLTGLFSKFKRRSKHTSEPGFIGGATLRNSESNPQSNHESTHGSPAPNHIPNVNDEDGGHSDVSSLSTHSARGRPMERNVSQESKVSELSNYEEARDTFNENLAPPPSFGTDINARNSGSPVRDSKFHEVL